VLESVRTGEHGVEQLSRGLHLRSEQIEQQEEAFVARDESHVSVVVGDGRQASQGSSRHCVTDYGRARRYGAVTNYDPTLTAGNERRACSGRARVEATTTERALRR
jgi:hypothetical protein